MAENLTHMTRFCYISWTYWPIWFIFSPIWCNICLLSIKLLENTCDKKQNGVKFDLHIVSACLFLKLLADFLHIFTKLLQYLFSMHSTVGKHFQLKSKLRQWAYKSKIKYVGQVRCHFDFSWKWFVTVLRIKDKQCIYFFANLKQIGLLLQRI